MLVSLYFVRDSSRGLTGVQILIPVCLGWGPRICISDEFPGGTREHWWQSVGTAFKYLMLVMATRQVVTYVKVLHSD